MDRVNDCFARCSGLVALQALQVEQRRLALMNRHTERLFNGGWRRWRLMVSGAAVATSGVLRMTLALRKPCAQHVFHQSKMSFCFTMPHPRVRDPCV